MARKRKIVSDLNDTSTRPEQRQQTADLIKMNEQNNDLSLTPPNYLDDFAKELYEVLAQYLVKNKYVNESDETTLVAFCLNCSMMKQASESIKNDGLVYYDSRGNLKRNPSASIINDVSSKIQSLGGSLGFNPNARIALQTLIKDDTKPSASDVLSAFGGDDE